MTELFLRILNVSVAASFLIAAVALLRFVMRKNAPKWVFCLLWGVVALRLVLPFSIQSPFGLVPEKAANVSAAFAGAETDPAPAAEQTPLPPENANTPEHTAQTPEYVPSTPQTPEYVPQTPPNPQTPALPDPAPAQTPPAGPAQPAEAVQPAEAAHGAEYYLSIVWAAGIAAMLVYAMINYVLLRRRLTDSVKYQEGVRLSDKIRCPFVLGLFRPTVYLPFGLDGRTESFVLSHERAHISRGDHWFKLLWYCVLALHWYNPLVWVSFILVCRDIEYACDERVFAGMPEDERKAYASALLELGVHTRRIAACPVAFGESNVKHRVRRVFGFKKPAVWIIALILVASAVLAACFATERGGSQPEESSDSDEISADVFSEDEYKAYKLGVRVDSVPSGEALTEELDNGIVYYKMNITTGEHAGTTEIYRFEDMYCDPVCTRGPGIGSGKKVVLFRGNHTLALQNPVSSYLYGGDYVRNPAQYGIFEDKILSLDFSADNKAPDDLRRIVLIDHTTFKDPQKAFGTYTDDDYERVWYNIATDGTVIRNTYKDGEIIKEYSGKKLDGEVTAYFFALYFIETDSSMVYWYDSVSGGYNGTPSEITVKYGRKERSIQGSQIKELFEIIYKDGESGADGSKTYYFDYTFSAAPHGDYPSEPVVRFGTDVSYNQGEKLWIDVMQDGTLLSESYLGDQYGLYMRTRIVSLHKCDVSKLNAFMESMGLRPDYPPIEDEEAYMQEVLKSEDYSWLNAETGYEDSKNVVFEYYRSKFLRFFYPQDRKLILSTDKTDVLAGLITQEQLDEYYSECGMNLYTREFAKCPHLYRILKKYNVDKEAFRESNNKAIKFFKSFDQKDYLYYKASYSFTDEEIDVLFGDDEQAVIKTFKKACTLYYNGQIYHCHELLYQTDDATLRMLWDAGVLEPFVNEMIGNVGEFMGNALMGLDERIHPEKRPPVVTSEGLEYIQTGGGAYYVSGIGECGDTDLIIPSEHNGLPVTGISDNAFADCGSIESVVIPDSVQRIGAKAFYNCSRLITVLIGDGVTVIGESAFRNSGYINNLTIGKNVREIHAFAFERIFSLGEAVIPDSIVFMGESVFESCNNLGKLTLGKGLTVIPKNAFNNCERLYNITGGGNVKQIEEGAFANCTFLTEFTVPAWTASIGSGAFENCQRLNAVYYDGNAERWKQIIISERNEPLNNADLVFLDNPGIHDETALQIASRDFFILYITGDTDSMDWDHLSDQLSGRMPAIQIPKAELNSRITDYSYVLQSGGTYYGLNLQAYVDISFTVDNENKCYLSLILETDDMSELIWSVKWFRS